jgi:hypothetical protein
MEEDEGFLFSLEDNIRNNHQLLCNYNQEDKRE